MIVHEQRSGRAVITFEPLGGEDGSVIEIEGTLVTIETSFPDADTWGWRSIQAAPRAVMTASLTMPNGYTATLIPGDITKGARALWEDKHPDQDVPPLHGLAGTDLAKRLRRKAKAVLDAVKA